MLNQLFSLKPTLIFQHSLPLIKPPTYTYTAYIVFIPAHIPTQPALHLSPTYTYMTAYISFIPPTKGMVFELFGPEKGHRFWSNLGYFLTHRH